MSITNKDKRDAFIAQLKQMQGAIHAHSIKAGEWSTGTPQKQLDGSPEPLISSSIYAARIIPHTTDVQALLRSRRLGAKMVPPSQVTDTDMACALALVAHDVFSIAERENLDIASILANALYPDDQTEQEGPVQADNQ